jgi:hypothetical protein
MRATFAEPRRPAKAKGEDMTVAVRLSLLCALAAPSAALAQTPDEPVPREERPHAPGTLAPLDPFHMGFGVSSGVGWLDGATARDQAIGQAGVNLHLVVAAEVLDLISTAFSFGTVFVSDEAAFEQEVTNEFDPGTPFAAESALNLYIFALTGGLRTPDYIVAQLAAPGHRAALSGYARFGPTWVSGQRSIIMCVDCHEEELALADGTLLEVGANLALMLDGLGISLLAGYKQYFSSAVGGEIDLGCMLWFF